jgi:hypothetical protein
MKSQGASDPLARTAAVNALVIGQVFYLLNSRFKIDSSLSPFAHLGNRYLPMGVGAVIVLQLLYTYAPPLQSVFETEALPLGVWPWLFLGGLIFFFVVEIEKAIIRATRSRRAICIQARDPATLCLVLRSAEGASRRTAPEDRRRPLDHSSRRRASRGPQNEGLKRANEPARRNEAADAAVSSGDGSVPQRERLAA